MSLATSGPALTSTPFVSPSEPHTRRRADSVWIVVFIALIVLGLIASARAFLVM